MQCSVCGSNLVRGFTFCLECGNPVPPELLEESGLPQRNIDRGPQEITVPKTANFSANAQSYEEMGEEIGELQPKLIGGDIDSGEELQPQLMGGDTYESGQALKPRLMGVGDDEEGEALKPKLMGGEEQAGVGVKVKAAMQNSSADVSDNAVEKLVFCPNCGMHMQHDTVKCEICGMTLGNMPINVPKSASGMPLFNTEPDPFSGAGGFGGFGGFGGISDEVASRTDNLVNSGNTNPMFNSGSSAFNVQTTPADIAHLTQQLANFSAGADMPNIAVTENTRFRQKPTANGNDVKLEDFAINDDLQSESIPFSNSGVPVVGDYSMEDNPDEYINLDPFAFVGMLMGEEPENHSVSSKSVSDIRAAVPVEQVRTASLEPIAAPKPEPVRAPKLEPVGAPAVESVRATPAKPPSMFGEQVVSEETAPFAAGKLPEINGLAEAPIPKKTVAPKNPPNPMPRPKQSSTGDQPPGEWQAHPTTENRPTTTASAAPKTKKCFECGRIMPFRDKFCPNCGLAMSETPSPKPVPTLPPPQKKSNKAVIIVIIVLLIIIAAIVVGIFLFKGNAAEIDFDRLTQTVFNAAEDLPEDISQTVL